MERLFILEQEYMDKLKPSLNSYRAYEKNKELRREKAKQKFNCECGGKYTRGVKARHLKTIKHTTYISSNLN